MISAPKIKILTSLDVSQLTQALERGGYADVFLNKCHFRGLTDNKKFCYEAVYTDDRGWTGTVKIYAWHDSHLGHTVADF
jgi:hypothetical protein